MALLGRRVLLLVNPGSRRGARGKDKALRAFARAGAECTAVLTTRPGHAAEEAAARGRDYDAVFTLGGDGTVMEVVGALAFTGVPVGVLAGGTGNLVARVLGIPLSIARAVPALLDGDLVQIDLGVINGRRFAFAAGVGVDAVMVAETSPSLKRRVGALAYIFTAARAALRRDRFDVVATVDGREMRRRATALMIANFGAVFGDLIRIGPGIRQDDGMLDLCVFSPETLWESFRIAWRMLRKDFRPDPCMLYTAGRHMRIETVPSRDLQADGDLLGKTPIEVIVEPLAATLLVPHRP